MIFIKVSPFLLSFLLLAFKSYSQAPIGGSTVSRIDSVFAYEFIEDYMDYLPPSVEDTAAINNRKITLHVEVYMKRASGADSVTIELEGKSFPGGKRTMRCKAYEAAGKQFLFDGKQTVAFKQEQVLYVVELTNKEFRNLEAVNVRGKDKSGADISQYRRQIRQ